MMEQPQPLPISSSGMRNLKQEMLVSEAFAAVLGKVVAEKQKEFDQMLAIRDAEAKAFQARNCTDARAGDG